MEKQPDKWECANCGFTAEGKFEDDICPQCNQTHWKCSECGYIFTAATPPKQCPGCNKPCDFLNVTCYTPECGGPQNIDPRLV